MLNYDFDENSSYWIGLTAHLFNQALNNEMTKTGVTLRQVQVLSCLSLYGDLSQTALAKQLQIEPSTLVRILDRMERRGWIERCDSPRDRRKKIIRSTEKINKKWEEIIEHGERVEKQANEGLTHSQLKTLKETLEIIRSNLGSLT